MPEFFPIMLRVQGQRVLVVGGGEVALRKVTQLVEFGALIHVVAIDILPGVAELATQVTKRAFAASDVQDVVMCVAATNDRTVNAAVATAGGKLGVPVNVVDDRELCSATFPAIIRRDPVLIALASGGTSPMLLRWLRERIEPILPSRLGAVASFVHEMRARVQTALPDLSSRRRLWARVIDGSVAQRLLRGDQTGAQTDFTELLEHAQQAHESASGVGRVDIVGAGPGDPDLLTLKALRAMQQCDVVLYDNLLADDILRLVRRDAERFYVGKVGRDGDKSVAQEDTNAMLVARAQAGQRVLRLKGGDPFIFGRGGEEMGALIDAGIEFDIVPGITAATGCAAYAGIPLTHREVAQSVRFVTGHTQNSQTNLDWPELARDDQTLVIYMGLGGIRQICSQLIQHGAQPDLPIAIISRGTRTDQVVHVSTLAALPDEIAGPRLAATLQRPTLSIIGRVVALHRRDVVAGSRAADSRVAP